MLFLLPNRKYRLVHDLVRFPVSSHVVLHISYCDIHARPVILGAAIARGIGRPIASLRIIVPNQAYAAISRNSTENAMSNVKWMGWMTKVGIAAEMNVGWSRAGGSSIRNRAKNNVRWMKRMW